MQSLVSGQLKAASSTLLRQRCFDHQIRFRLLPGLCAYITKGQPYQFIVPAAMSGEAEQIQILAAFKTADDEAAFTESFKLVSAVIPGSHAWQVPVNRLITLLPSPDPIN
jgi:hypothetical protein